MADQSIADRLNCYNSCLCLRQTTEADGTSDRERCSRLMTHDKQRTRSRDRARKNP